MSDVVWESEDRHGDSAPPNWLGPWIDRARQAKGEWIEVRPGYDLYAKVFDKKTNAQSYKSVVRSGKLPALSNTRDQFDAEIGKIGEGWILRIRLNNKENNS